MPQPISHHDSVARYLGFFLGGATLVEVRKKIEDQGFRHTPSIIWRFRSEELIESGGSGKWVLTGTGLAMWKRYLGVRNEGR